MRVNPLTHGSGGGSAASGWWRRWRTTTVGSIVAVAAVAAYFAGVGPSRASTSTAVVERGDFVDVVELRGDIRPVRSVVLAAPTQAGDLQIVKLVKNGTAVRQGDVVVQFDRTGGDRYATDRRAELKQAEAETARVRAQARITEEASATNLMKARFDVERARLDVVDRDFIARIDVEKARLALSDAEQRLKEAGKRQVADQAAAAAEVAGRVRRQERIQQDLNRIEKVLASFEIRAPAGGTANLMPNSRWGPSNNAQDFREGDRAWPGAAIVELPDLSAVHLAARLDESDRGRVIVGQTATVQLDAVADRPYRSTVAKISLLARVDFASNWPPARDFDLELAMGDPDARLKPGMTATVRIAVARYPNVLLVPARAVRLVNGQPTVYVQRGSEFVPRAVVIAHQNREQAALKSGVEPGDRLAIGPPLASGGPQQ